MERKQQHVHAHAHAQTQDASTLTRAWHRRQGPPYPVPTTTWTLVRVIEALQLEKAPSLSRTRDMSVSGPLGLGGMDRQPGGEHGAWSMEHGGKMDSTRSRRKRQNPREVHVAASRAVYDEYPPGSWCSII